MPKEKMKKLLYELMKNSRRSDRELAKVVNVSQPTITRARKEFENLGFIKEYTIIPEFTMIGFEIMAFTSMNINSSNESGRKITDYVENSPEILYGAPGTGMGDKNYFMASLHSNFTEFNEFISRFKEKWATNILSIETFLVSLKSRQMKHLSFKRVEEMFQEES